MKPFRIYTQSWAKLVKFRLNYPIKIQHDHETLEDALLALDEVEKNKTHLILAGDEFVVLQYFENRETKWGNICVNPQIVHIRRIK